MLFVSIIVAIIACVRGWFPWALVVLAVPYCVQILQLTPLDSGTLSAIRGFFQSGLPIHLVSTVALAAMALIGRE